MNRVHRFRGRAGDGLGKPHLARLGGDRAHALGRSSRCRAASRRSPRRPPSSPSGRTPALPPPDSRGSAGTRSGSRCRSSPCRARSSRGPRRSRSPRSPGSKVSRNAANTPGRDSGKDDLAERLLRLEYRSFAASTSRCRSAPARRRAAGREREEVVGDARDHGERRAEHVVGLRQQSDRSSACRGSSPSSDRMKLHGTVRITNEMKNGSRSRNRNTDLNRPP